MKTIYLNHAGTSWPKPDCVHRAVEGFRDLDPADWGREFDQSHRNIAAFFGVTDAERLLLTPGCTSALALAIADMPWQPNDAIVVSSWEHHAVYRPAQKLVARGVEVRIVPPGSNGPFDLERFETFLKTGRVRLVAVSAASNVTGDLLPIAEIIRIAHEHETVVLIDAAQIVGWLPLDFPATGADMIAFGGHKGLQAPWGIGGLYVAPHISLDTPAAVCKLPMAKDQAVCAPMPGYCDGGSVDRFALAGLATAVRWLEEPAQQERLTRCRGLIDNFQNQLQGLPQIQAYGNEDRALRIPTLAFNFVGRDSNEIASRLGGSRLFVGSGLQCAPLAHETLGTSQTGAIRVSVGPQTTEEELLQAAELIASLAEDFAQ